MATVNARIAVFIEALIEEVVLSEAVRQAALIPAIRPVDDARNIASAET